MRKTLCISAALLALAACSTEEISTPITYVGTGPGPDRGLLMIVFAPSADTEEEGQAQARANTTVQFYGIFVDGRQLAFDGLGSYAPAPVTIGEGGMYGGGYLSAGPHHFEIAVAGGGPVIFAGDAEIPPGSTTRLYVFGHAGARQGRFVSYPSVTAPGMLHVSLMNLVRLAPGLEVVSCADATSCAPLSPPLAFGQSFDADFAAGTSDGTRYSLATGASIGFRQIATAALPAPPVQPMSSIFDVLAAPGTVPPAPANLVFAPIYMTAEGNVSAIFYPGD
jgi:hypothetical protein